MCKFITLRLYIIIIIKLKLKRMDYLHAAGGATQMKLHDACFDRCVSNFGSKTLDSSEEQCLKSCFKSFALTYKQAQSQLSTFYYTEKAH